MDIALWIISEEGEISEEKDIMGSEQ